MKALRYLLCLISGGAPNTKCWIFQVIGDRIKILEALTGGIDCKTPAHWAARLKAKSYNYGSHFLPHDGKTLWVDLFTEANLPNVVVLDKPQNVWDPINDALSAISRCDFNKSLCKDGLTALEAFHSKEESDGLTIKDVPVHDWSSHFSTFFNLIFLSDFFVFEYFPIIFPKSIPIKIIFFAPK